MEEILHQLIGGLSMFYPIMFKALYIQTVVVWDFWTINSFMDPSRTEGFHFSP